MKKSQRPDPASMEIGMRREGPFAYQTSSVPAGWIAP
jgi:hypothetical protein